MISRLCHLYGPFYIYSYGLAILIAILTILTCLYYDKKRQKLISFDMLIDATCISIISALLGGRLLYITESWNNISSPIDVFSLWNGGLSSLGSIIGFLLIMPFYLYIKKIPILPLFDRVALYAPVLQSIARIGCFFSGCCYGIRSNIVWAITYNDPYGACPSTFSVHPTQLYSSLGMILFFIILYKYVQYIFNKPGQLFSIYLIGMNCERFLIDFLRAERTVIDGIFSATQYIAIILILIGIFLFLLFTRNNEPI